MTASIALARRGVRCQIVERASDWRPAGIGIGLQSAPLRALKSLDLLEPLVEVGRPHDGIDMLLADGSQIGVMPQVNVNEPDDPPFITMSRMALHQVLERRLRELGVEVRLGLTASTFEEQDGCVRARFSDGGEAVYDFAIGADGMHSQTRGMVLPDAPEPEYAGQVIWRIGVPRPQGLERYTMMIAGPTRIGLVPIGDEQLYMWMLDSTLPPERPPRDELLSLFRERMGAYAGFAPEVAAQITEPEQLDFRALHWVLVPPPWGAGRVLLLGDAAHTTTPHLAFGVGLAIEDAVVLADLVADGCDPRDLAARLTERRYERCRLVVDTCLHLSRWEQMPGPPNPRAGELIGSAMAALSEPI